MSESDTMFNERDRRCAAVQLMLSTNPSYDNRTIVSTLKMQIRTVQRLRAQLNTSDDPLEVVERKATSCHLTFWNRLESQHQSVPGCAEECGDHLVQSGDRWQTLGVASGLVWNKTIFIKMDFALNNLQMLICQKTRTNNHHRLIGQIVIFVPKRKPYQMLPVRVRVDQGTMVMKE